MVECPGRSQRRSPQGRRSVRVRAWRRGGRGAGRGRDPVRGGPGVTAGVVVPPYAGIPLTHREDASAVAFVTGHEDPSKDDSAIDWARSPGFPGRSSSTWASAACPRSPSACSRGGARPASRRPPSSETRCRANDLPRRWPTPADVAARGDRRTGDRAYRARWRRGARRSPGWSAALCRPGASSAPGRAPRRAAWRGAARSGRGRGRAAGDPDRAPARLPEVREAVPPSTPTRSSA